MITALFVLYGLLDLAMLGLSMRLKSNWPLWLVRALLFGMLWDNSVLALSGLGIGSSWYEFLNYPRFVFHAAFLPFLTLFGLTMMQCAGVKISSHTAMIGFCWMFTVCALIYGFYEGVFLLELKTQAFAEHIRLTSASSSPPWGTIATNILLLPMALSVWVRGGYPWLFLGTVFIFCVNGTTGSQEWGILSGNGAEVVFTLCLLHTTFELSSRPTTGSAPA